MNYIIYSPGFQISKHFKYAICAKYMIICISVTPVFVSCTSKITGILTLNMLLGSTNINCRLGRKRKGTIFHKPHVQSDGCTGDSGSDATWRLCLLRLLDVVSGSLD